MGRIPSCIYGSSIEIGLHMGGSSNTNLDYTPVEAFINGGGVAVIPTLQLSIGCLAGPFLL